MKRVFWPSDKRAETYAGRGWIFPAANTRAIPMFATRRFFSDGTDRHRTDALRMDATSVPLKALLVTAILTA